MTLTLIRRKPYLSVLIDGRPLPSVLSVRATFGLDQDMSSLNMICPRGVPDWVRLESRVTVIAGANVATARQRFTGYVSGFAPVLNSGEFGVLAKGPLLKAAYKAGDGSSFQGMTHVDAIASILTTCGIAVGDQDLQGDPTDILGANSAADDTRYVWDEARSGLAVIQDIDKASGGFRTMDLPSGIVARRWVSSIPTDATAFTFTEGVDVIDGTAQIERKTLPLNEIQVSGWGGASGSATSTNPAIPSGSSVGFIESRLIDSTTAAQALANYVLAERNRTIVTFTFLTPLDYLLQAGMTVRLSAPVRLELDQKAWVKRLEISVEAEAFTQSLTCITDLGIAIVNRGQGPKGTPIVLTPPILPPPPPPPNPDPVLVADFTVVKVQQERRITAGAAGIILEVSVEDATVPLAASGIATRTWTPSAGGTPSTASGLTAVFAFSDTDYPTATITLEVTDTATPTPHTASITKTIADTGVSIPNLRKLYAAAGGMIEAFGGTLWKTGTPTDPSQVVANGPLWGGAGFSYVSADDLATAPAAGVAAFLSGDITALWVEVDVSTSRMAAGSSGGQVATSDDGGATWVLQVAPAGADPILRVILSRSDQNQVFALALGGIYVSADGGATWTTLRAGAVDQEFQDLTLSHSHNVVASKIVGAGAPLETMEDGTAFTFPVLTPPVTDVRAVFAHIRQDAFACYDDQGRTFFSDDGGFTMTQGADLPSSILGAIRGGYRDGDVPGLLYFAAGNDGIWKSLDFFATAEGYHQLRAPSIDGAGSGPWYQVGAGSAGAEQSSGGVEIYFYTSSHDQLYVCKSDGSIAAQGSVIISGGSMSDLVSYDDANTVAIWVAGPSSPPWLFLESTDGGVTLVETDYPDQPASDNPSAVFSVPAATLSYTDWWARSGATTPTGGVYRNSTGVAGTDYFRKLTTDINIQIVPCDDRIYILRHVSFSGDWFVDVSIAGAAATQVETFNGGHVASIRGRIGNVVMFYHGNNFGDPVTIERFDGTTITTPTGIASSQTYMSNVSRVGSVTMMLTLDGTNANVWKSADDGASWTLVKSYVADQSTAPQLAPAWQTPGVWWASNANESAVDGWYRTADDGATWTFVAGPQPEFFRAVGAGRPSSSGGAGF